MDGKLAFAGAGANENQWFSRLWARGRDCRTGRFTWM